MANRRNRPPFLRDIVGPIGRRPIAKDRFGRELCPGDEVMLPLLRDFTPMFRVSSAAPVLDPGAPPNLVRVVLTTVLPVTVESDKPVPEIVLIRTVQEIDGGHEEAGGPAGEPSGGNGGV